MKKHKMVKDTDNDGMKKGGKVKKKAMKVDGMKAAKRLDKPARKASGGGVLDTTDAGVSPKSPMAQDSPQRKRGGKC